MRRGIWASTASVVILVALSLLVLTALRTPQGQGEEAVPASSTSSVRAQSPAPPSLTDQKTQAEIDKLREETRQLDIQSDRNRGWFGYALAVGPFVTAIVAVLTLGATLSKQRGDARHQHDEDRRVREKELQERFDAQFSNAVDSLGSNEPGRQAGGASSLLRLQKSASPEMQVEIYLYASTQLRIANLSDNVTPIMRDVLRDSLVAVLSRPAVAHNLTINLSQANLERINLSRVSFGRLPLCLERADLTDASLSEADLWGAKGDRLLLTRADCTKANFGPAVLTGANLIRAKMNGARFGSANLKNVDASGSSFRGAALQSAHFEGARLLGVDFSHSDVNDTYFIGASFDSATLGTLRLAKNLQRAHLDQAVTDLMASPT